MNNTHFDNRNNQCSMVQGLGKLMPPLVKNNGGIEFFISTSLIPLEYGNFGVGVAWLSQLFWQIQNWQQSITKTDDNQALKTTIKWRPNKHANMCKDNICFKTSWYTQNMKCTNYICKQVRVRTTGKFYYPLFEAT